MVYCKKPVSAVLYFQKKKNTKLITDNAFDTFTRVIWLKNLRLIQKGPAMTQVFSMLNIQNY